MKVSEEARDAALAAPRPSGYRLMSSSKKSLRRAVRETNKMD
jgi:hypothetical protein